jgi:HK97 family phage major capsid protein
LTSLTASAGSLVRPDRRADVVVPPQRPRFIRDMLNSVPTTSNAVEVMRQLAFTNNANMQGVAEATAYELTNKPESEITYELITVNIRTIAHHLIASRQIMSDARMLQSLVDNRLEYGLALKLDQQLLFGAGTGQQLTGLMVDSDVTDLGAIAALETGETEAGKMLDHIRRAITQCQVNEFYNINGLILNPIDWATLELAKGSDGHYIWVTVPNGGEARLWRVPVTVTNAMTQSDFILGDFQMGATLYDREQLEIRIADQHASLFIQNGLAILAEERLGLGIELPKAFTKGSFEILT